ncbi:hypothetical protein H4R19_005988 [Coemansia spiralis]|nr:hypothetical protein H4R19_005988 [Coemansia spiralis]
MSCFSFLPDVSMVDLRRGLSMLGHWLAGDRSDKPAKLVRKRRPSRLQPGPHVISSPTEVYHTWDTLVALVNDYTAEMAATETKKCAAVKRTASKTQPRIVPWKRSPSVEYLHGMLDLFPMPPRPQSAPDSPATAVTLTPTTEALQSYTPPSRPRSMEVLVLVPLVAAQC